MRSAKVDQLDAVFQDASRAAGTLISRRVSVAVVVPKTCMLVAERSDMTVAKDEKSSTTLVKLSQPTNIYAIVF